MIPNAIGLPNPHTKRLPYTDASDWMVNNGLQPYTPQTRFSVSENLGAVWDDNNLKMLWPNAAIGYTSQCASPMIFSYGKYWYETKPDVLHWNIDGVRYTQDAIPYNMMIDVLHRQRIWFVNHDMPDAWIHCDEPPHAKKYGWTQEIEDRVIKFLSCAIEAGWNIRISLSGHWQYNFWRPILPDAIKYNLHTQTQFDLINDYLPDNLWLYNKRDTYSGLAELMNHVNAEGYLSWSAISDVDGNPILWEDGAPTDEMSIMLSEFEKLENMDKPKGNIKIMQPMLSQVIEDWRRIDEMLNCDIIEMQAEFSKTRFNAAGDKYVPGHKTPFEYVKDFDIIPLAYFDFMWPSPWELSSPRDPENDPYWLRKKHIKMLEENPDWTRQSPIEDRPYSNTANQDYCDYLVNLLLSTDIEYFMFDDCKIHGNPADVVSGMFYVFDELRMNGVKVWANNSWHMDNPTLDSQDWGYPAISHLDGVMVEHWTGHNDGCYYEGKWYPLTDAGFMQVQKDWMSRNKDVAMVARYRSNESHLDTYDRFCQHYIQMSQSVFVPCRYNYYYPNWLPWFKEYQDQSDDNSDDFKQFEKRLSTLEAEWYRFKKGTLASLT